jgi:hypothetical protein
VLVVGRGKGEAVTMKEVPYREGADYSNQL